MFRTGLGSSKGLRLLSVSPKGVLSWSCNEVVAALFLHKAELSCATRFGLIVMVHYIMLELDPCKSYVCITNEFVSLCPPLPPPPIPHWLQGGSCEVVRCCLVPDVPRSCKVCSEVLRILSCYYSWELVTVESL